MATDPYNDLGSLYNATDSIELPTNGVSSFEIIPDEFAGITFENNLSVDTFTTNLLGNPTPSLCSGLISWISDGPAGAPIADGLLGGNVNVTTSGKLDLTWALSTDVANVVTTDGSGNVIYDVDYILEYPDGTAAPGTPIPQYYLNVAYVNDTCLGNIANCNVSAPSDNVYTGDCGSSSSTWIGIQTKASKHCSSYPGEIYQEGNTSVGPLTNWNSSTSVYYPYGSVSDTSEITANTTVSYEFRFTSIGSGIYEGMVYSSSKASTLMWISDSAFGDPLITTNGCEAKKLVDSQGSQFTIKKSGNTRNRDLDLDQLGSDTFFVNIQGYNLGDSAGKSISNTLRIEFQEVTEDDANVNYNAPLKSRTEVTPIGFTSGRNTVFDFPESGDYIISAVFTDDTGAVYTQSKNVTVDLESNPEASSTSVVPRDPNYGLGSLITRGFLGYGPQYQCKPGKFGNDPKYALIGSNFKYNSVDYKMTTNIAQCLAFNCLDNCLGININGTGPNGILSRGTVDNCEPNYYGDTQSGSEVIAWQTDSFTDIFTDIESDILTYPIVIPTKSLSGTSTVHATVEADGNNTLMWISTEPGGGPNNCYGFLESYQNYYSMNGQMKFYATYSNGIVEKFSKSHAQLEMGHTYYLNIAKITGTLQNFLSGNKVTFVRNKNLTVTFNGMSSWNYKDSVKPLSPAAGIDTSDPVDGTTFSNVSISSEVLPVSYAVNEDYGICAETWDSGESETTQIKVNPNSRVAMPFTTTTRMFKGEIVISTGSKPYSSDAIRAYIVDAPEKTAQFAYGKPVKGTINSQNGSQITYDIEIEVDGYTPTASADAVLSPFTTYYLILENNIENIFTGTRTLTMEYNASYGLPNTNYSLYPPWCINSSKMNVGGAPNGTSTGNQTIVPSNKLGADLNCKFRDNATVNYYLLGQRFTIKGTDIICNSLIAECLKEKVDPTVQDVLRCAGINHDSLNPDTPFANPSNPGGLPKNNDNALNTEYPDPEILTFTSGSGSNVFGTSTAGTTKLTGGATDVDPMVRDAINSGDYSDFNLFGLKNNAFTGNGAEVNWQDYLSQFNKYGNYTSFSNYPLTGDSDLIPSSFRIRKRKVKNPNVYGFDIPLKDGRFVNATSQRVTGGTVKPLSRPLKIIPRIPRAIKTFNVRDEAYGKVVPSNLNQTYRNTYYNPRSVGAYFSTKGRQIQNIKNTGFIADPQSTPPPGGGFVISSGANDSVPSTTPRIARDSLDIAGGDDYLLPDELQPIAQDINYAPVPDMTMQPLKIDENGNYVPAGPAARMNLTQPSPEASISALQAAAVADGSELYINDRKIVFKYGGSLESIKTQINCGKLGVTSVIGEDANTGQQILTISSCDSSPWTVANGCGGGTFQQIGDFHINRGFEQSKTVTSVFIPQDQLTSGGGGGNSNVTTSTSIINIPYTDQNFPSTGRLVDVNFDRELYIDPTYPLSVPAGETFAAKNFQDFDVPNDSGILLPQESITVSTAGKGYKVGDRLRLVGGTPVNTNKGPLTVICIESAGAGYVDPAKLTVQIGDGSTPGFGAVAEVYSLDMNGGISEIRLLNYGVGYDPARPPKISIIDNHSPTAYATQKITNGLNQFDEVILTRDDIIRFDYPEIVESNDSTVDESYVQVTQTYYRVSSSVGDSQLIIGGTNDANLNKFYYGGKTVDGNYPTIDISTGTLYGNVTHTRYKAVIGLPSSVQVTRGQYIRISSTGTGANASIVNSMPEFLCSDHMIGKDGSGNDVIAYNIPIVRHRALLNASTIDAIALLAKQ
jgi:hypothetical protein